MAIKTKRKQIEYTEATTVLDSVKGIKIGDVVSQVNNLQVSLQETLAKVCATVTTKMKQVEEIDTAITLKNQRLKELFNIEQESLSLEEIRAQHDQESLDWTAERDAREKKEAEEEKERIKNLNRTEADWIYEFQKRTKKDQEDLDVQIASNKRNEQIRQDNFQRIWEEREKILKTKEQEHQNLLSQVAGFEAKLADAVKKAENSGFASAAAKYNHEIALLKKDAESEKKVAEMRIISLTSQIEGYNNQIEDIHKQLQSARQDAKDVASEALRSASSRQLAETLQKVVTETQPNSGKSK